MSFLRRQRRCNQCDDRDLETYVEGGLNRVGAPILNPLCCKKCGPSKDKKPPCSYLVRFGCQITSTFTEEFNDYSGVVSQHVFLTDGVEEQFFNARFQGCKTDTIGNVTLRPRCNYRDPCNFLSIQNFRYGRIRSQNGNDDICSIRIFNFGVVCDGCSWSDRIDVSESLIHSIEYGWQLNLEDLSKVKLTHLMYGLSYAMKSGETWDCFAKNTLYLTTGKDSRFINLPTAVCIVPNPINYADYCESVLAYTDMNQDLYKYNNETNRCACCDDVCNCVNGTIRIICGTNVMNANVQYCIGGRTGVQDPAGPSREACSNFTDTHGVLHQICVVVYCVDGGVWKADWYCDGHYDGTVTLTSTCCPLTATGNGPPLSCMDCTGCVGISVDPTCQPPPPPCCYLTSYPTTMTLAMYTGCVGWPATVMLAQAGSTFSGSFQVGITVDTVSILFDATTCVLKLTCSSTGAQSFVNMTAVSCSPPSLTGTATFSILNPFYCGCGFFDSVALVLG